METQPAGLAPRVTAIVAAGGIGKRLGARGRKSFVPLAGRPMLYWTLAALARCRRVEGLVVVVHPLDLERTRRLIRSCRIGKVKAVVPGGATRAESVFQGLRALPREVRWVAVHDAARPLVTASVVEGTLAASRASGAATAAVAVVPTIKEARNRWVVRTLDRRSLWEIQTPQIFRRDLLERAHAKARTNGSGATDDAALVERLGVRVRVAPGSPRNIKVTTKEDLVIAKVFLKNAHRHRI